MSSKFGSKEQYLATLAYNKRRYLALRYEIFNKLGNRCNRCGFEDFRALQIDHINGGGSRERKALGSPDRFHRHVLELNCEGYQLLCANCNFIKRYENNEMVRSGAASNLSKCEIVEPKYRKPNYQKRKSSY